MATSPLTALADHGNQLEARFKKLLVDTRSTEFKAVVADLRAWLDDCVAQGRFLPPGAPDRRALQGQVDYWTSRLRQAGQPCDEIDRLAPFDPQAGHVLADELFPYHGLLAATATGKVFAGRDEQIQEYADHIDGHAALLIQSESGGGKSSVAMAGVLPELQRRHPDWRVLPRVTPGTQPADTLREALGGLLSQAVVDARSVQAALKPGETLLVYIDQLEELLTMCTDVHQQEAFSDLLTTLADAGELRLVATMRVDHYERLAHSSACHRLYALLTRDGSVKTLPPMSLAQIRSVILKPAEAVGLRFVPASIVETLASETANAPSGLPLLQFALQRLWDERPRLGGQPDGPRLDMVTEASFKALPTLSTALGTVADRYFGEMQGQGLVDACRRLMLELTVIDERLEVPLRRRRAEAEVLAVLANSGLASPEQARALVDGLVERRLLVRSGTGDAQQIEVAHEALFRYWGRFQDWINDDDVRATLRETRQINRDALLWERVHRSADLLNLRGEPLARALRHLREHWLEPLAAAYVRACERSVADAENLSQQQQAQAKLAKDDAELAHAQARQAKARMRTFWQAATLVGLGVFGGIAWDQRERRKDLELRSTTTIAYVLPLLPPSAALDLAYTLQEKRRTAQSRASLAHAIDGAGRAALVGPREHKAAYFTHSGQATVQLVSDASGQLDHALVRALDPHQLEGLAATVKLPLNLKPGERLASLDVGPPMADGDRLAVASVLASDGAQGMALTLMRISRIGSAALATPVTDLPFPSHVRPTRTASEIAFDSSGTHVAVAARLRLQVGSGGDLTATQIVRWVLGETSPTAPDLPVGGDDAVTALAYTQGTQGTQSAKPELIMGRVDGRVNCGANGYTQLKNSGLPHGKTPPRVVALKFAGPAHFAAVHEDNSISIGDCDQATTQTVQLDGPNKPEQLAVWQTVKVNDQHAKALWLFVSYAMKGKLVCQAFNLQTRKDERCAGDGYALPRAVPAVDTDGRLLGYRVLDTAEPLMTFLDLGAGARQMDLTRGLPMATLKPDTVGQVVAASPNGMQQLRLERLGGKATEVVRLGSAAAADHPLAITDAQWAAVNDQGVAVVLTARRAEPRHQLSVITPGNQPLAPQPTFDDAACLKLSPDGRQVIVASDGGQVKRFALDGKPPAEPVVKPDLVDPRRDPVVACATGDGPHGTLVLATEEGQVRRYDAQAGQWRPMSRLFPFALGGAALDLSIDGGSRFVAVLSTRRSAACRNGADGHLLRIWDLQLQQSGYPVASACITRPLRAIGPLEKKTDGAWVLPLYQAPAGDLAGNALLRHEFACLACADGSAERALDSKIKAQAEALGARKLDTSTLYELYGIAL